MKRLLVLLLLLLALQLNAAQVITGEVVGITDGLSWVELRQLAGSQAELV